MNRAFLSHSSQQKELIKKIASNLGKSNCVFDEYEFESGMPLFEEILASLEKTELFVLFISDDSLNSKWVQKEITLARRNLEIDENKRIFPILIDKSIDVVQDSRIPDWLKDYLMKPYQDHFIITKKIRQRLREISFDQNPLFKAKENLFVGRNSLFEDFEAKIFSLNDVKPNSIIVSGLEGIGRRTFLKNALKRTNKIKEFYTPIILSLDSKDSIEDFIIKLQDFDDETSSEFLAELQKLSFSEKIQEAKNLLNKVQESNEIIFVIDSGCIVKPTSKVAEWYLEIIKTQKHKEIFTLNIVSRFRPSNGLLRLRKDIIHFHVTTLSEKDTEKLFVKYCDMLKLDLVNSDAKAILEVMNGTPSQVQYSVEYIKEYGIKDAAKNINELVDFGETQVYYLIDMVKSKGENSSSLLTLLSSFEFVSYEFIYSITENSSETEKLLDDFYILGIFDLVGANKEYIKVHYSIRDYLRRSKEKISSEYSKKLRQSIKNFITHENEHSDFKDISELLFNIKGAILEGHKLPEKYYIPSFVLKTIVELYYQGNYKNVISLIDKILENPSRLEDSLEREFRYWLCLTLARNRSSRFEIEIDHLDGSDYDFLYGFFLRFKGQFDGAMTFLKRALKKHSNSQKSKRELVNILLLRQDYKMAIDLAKQNYEQQKLNAFHIQAYFICLIRKPYLSKDDKAVIEDLFKSIEKSYDSKAKEIASVMKGEYEYYVKKNIPDAIAILRTCIKTNSSKHYPRKALEELYNNTGMTAAKNELSDKYGLVNKSFTD
ncbi:toll/interleukin-1 receptor domain-containing protein [Psychroflexus sediminis]|uniref:TIR domain-containing protein n=1 Tax=Psychroflexus sediminis TaxID=470826 RepID=A0A1G7XDP3_9FLAO|nr:toll/interleukin-1 receptor domain-containing protein [Psychroflexus sediminis]SDG82223.1 TIR domain-containing protein [Psychroflexus sediminis]